MMLSGLIEYTPYGYVPHNLSLYFREMEKVMVAFEGRPHWAKVCVGRYCVQFKETLKYLERNTHICIFLLYLICSCSDIL